ncbi:MAG: Holliday junction resolvase RuvX [Verrucomicrobiia bacterium]
MRVLALDYGTHRIGVAVSDETCSIAQPLETIPATPFADFLQRLKQIAKAKEVSLIIVGLPRNMDGSYGASALKVMEFVNALKDALTIPIKTIDERLSTVQAQKNLISAGANKKTRKHKIDQTAAAILLQCYLDSINLEGSQ